MSLPIETNIMWRRMNAFITLSPSSDCPEHHAAQGSSIELEHQRRSARAALHEREASREDGHLAGEVAVLVDRDRLGLARVHDLELAVEHDEELRGRLALLEQDLAGMHGALVRDRAQDVDLALGQFRKPFGVAAIVGHSATKNRSST